MEKASKVQVVRAEVPKAEVPRAEVRTTDGIKAKTAAKRHCMVVHAYYPLGETRVQRQAQALTKQGYAVDVICLRQDGEPAKQDEDGVTVYRLPLKRHRGAGPRLGPLGSMAGQMLEYLTFFVLAFFTLLFLHRRMHYGVVQVHNLPDFLIFAALFPRLTGARLILDLHDLMPEFFAARSEKSMSSLPVRVIMWQERLSCRFAHHVITVTDVWKETLIQRGVAAEKVSVVMNLADPDIFRPAEERPKKEKSGRGVSSGFHLVYHGTFTYRYGVDLILYALSEVRQEVPGVRLTLLGGGEYREELQRLVASLALEGHVAISERMLHASELPTVLARADVGIVPNRSNVFTDGLLPTKLMEYVALGIPVIAARTPTVAAYFDEKMVYFFQPGNAQELAQRILSLHGDRTRLLQLRQNADRFNRQYNWKSMANAYVALVNQLSGKSTTLQAWS